MSCDNCGNPYATEQRPWTTTPPTEPGWYWVLVKGDDTVQVARAEWRIDTPRPRTQMLFFVPRQRSYWHAEEVSHVMRIEAPGVPR